MVEVRPANNIVCESDAATVGYELLGELSLQHGQLETRIRFPRCYIRRQLRTKRCVWTVELESTDILAHNIVLAGQESVFNKYSLLYSHHYKTSQCHFLRLP